MTVDQNYIEETLGIIFYLKLIYMKQIGEINWSPIPKDGITTTLSLPEHPDCTYIHTQNICYHTHLSSLFGQLFYYMNIFTFIYKPKTYITAFNEFNEFNEKYRAIKTSVLCTLSTVQNGDIHIHIYIIYSVCTIGKFRFINCPV